MIALDLLGGIVELRTEDVGRLREAAAAEAGRSSAARDLSLLLDRALRGDRVALRRGELHALVAIARREALADVIDRIEQARGLGDR